MTVYALNARVAKCALVNRHGPGYVKSVTKNKSIIIITIIIIIDSISQAEKISAPGLLAFKLLVSASPGSSCNLTTLKITIFNVAVAIW